MFKPQLKLMVCGMGGHGKDTFCEFLDMPFISSSLMALDLCIWPRWGEAVYQSRQECFDARRNPSERVVWHDLIALYNTDDKSRLGKQIFSEYDIYCGNRCDREFNDMKRKGVFNYSVWVEATDRLPPESRESCKVTPAMCDEVITNNGSEEELLTKAIEFRKRLESNFTIGA